MIIESITLFNVGVFRGKQTVHLAPGDMPQRPVVLVGGENGRGKTTLLDSIHYALYGRASKLAKRGDLSWDDFLKGLIHRHSPSAEGAGITLMLRYTSEGEEHRLKVQRDWKVAGSRVKENLSVWLDEILAREISEDWTEFVENLIPARIAHLFLFDGEEISALADPEKAREILRTGIYGLLGADLVGRLEQDIQALARKYSAQAATAEENKEVDALERECLELRRRLDDAAAFIETTTIELNAHRKRRESVQRDYHAQGGHLVENRVRLEAEEALLEKQLEDFESERRKMQAGLWPLVGVLDILREIEPQAAKEQSVRGGREWLSRLEARDTKILENLRCAKVPSKSLDAIAGLLQNDRKTIAEELDNVQVVYGFSQQGFAQLQGLVGGGLQQEGERFRQLEMRIQETRDQVERIQRDLARIPDPEAVRLLLEERNSTEVEMVRLEALINQKQKEYIELQSACTQAERRYERYNAKLLESRLGALEANRSLEHLDRARNTVKAFKQALVERDIHRIEKEILASAQRLFSKQKLVKNFVIDSETFEYKISDFSNKVFSPHQLSAGERQILAISILWGLSKASGKTLPIVIDTPLGRLDHDHKDKLLSSYFPYAGPQVVLLATEEEITPQRYEQISPWVGRVCSLVFDEESQVSKFENGRFFDDVQHFAPKPLFGKEV